MSYRLDIKDNSLCIQGLYGAYEAIDDGKGGFIVSVILDTCVNELDAEGEEYLVESGQEWSVPAENLTELNAFIKKCEDEKLWNYMCGPVFRMKPDTEKGILYIRGQSKSFVIGEDEKGLYIDEAQAGKNHKHEKDLLAITQKMTREDKWWTRPADETMDIARNMRCAALITSGGNLRLEYRNKSILIVQKDDGTFSVNVVEGMEKHILYKDNWKDVLSALV